MKKLLLFLFIILSIFIQAQPYQKMLGEVNSWYSTSCFNGSCVTVDYHALDDTIINGKNYKFLDGYHYNRAMLIREDTLARQIFLHPLSGVFANQDVLAYDFSLNINDVMTLYNPNSPLPSNGGKFKVDSILVKTYLGNPLHTFYLSDINNTTNTIWVEGVGALSLINTPSAAPDLNGIGDLSCFYKNNIQIYESDTLPNGQCDTTKLPVLNSINKITQQNFKIYPNPGNDYFIIETKSKIHKITIYDINGKAVNEKQIAASNNFEKINSEAIPAGFYFVEIATEYQPIRKKWVKH